MKAPKIEWVKLLTLFKALNAFANLWYNWRKDMEEYFWIDFETQWKPIYRVYWQRKWYIPVEIISMVKEYYWRDKVEEILNEQIEEVVEEDLSRSFNRKVERSINQSNTKAKEFMYSIEKQEQLIKSIVANTHKVSKNPFKIKKHYWTNWKLIVCFSDIHFWKKWHDKVVERFNYILNYAISQPEKNIVLIFWWDLVETLSYEEMHIWQIAWMDITWQKLGDTVMSLMKNFLLELLKHWKTVEAYLMPWNHDRLTREHHTFDTSIWKTAVLSIIAAMFENVKNIKVNVLKEVWNNFQVDWINFIWVHWDDKTVLKDYRDVYTKYGRYDTPNIWIHWHLHYATYSDLWKNFYDVWIWALAWEWDYSKWCLLNWVPSFTVIRMNEFNLPDIEIKKIWIFD